MKLTAKDSVTKVKVEPHESGAWVLRSTERMQLKQGVQNSS